MSDLRETREHRAGSGTVAAARVADVLLAIADAPGPIGVSELGRQLQISKAVVHRILTSLAERQLVAQVPMGGAYTLGSGAARVGGRALASFDLRRLALPVLRELHARTSETTTVSALVATQRFYLDQVVSLKEIRMTVEIGVPFPLHAGGSGKAILAFVPEDLQEAVLHGALTGLTPATITDAGELREQLAEIRRRGVAISRGERQSGAASIAAPVFGFDGTAIGSVSVCGPRDRLDQDALEAMVDDVILAAQRVTEAMVGKRRAG